VYHGDMLRGLNDIKFFNKSALRGMEHDGNMMEYLNVLMSRQR
jgi:hypothetical protein